MALELDNVRKTYGALEVLPAFSLEIGNGEFLTLLGPSGSGKTTVLKLIGGFVAADGGRILFEGADVTLLPANRRPFNTVFQDYALFPHMTVAQNAGYGPLVQRRDPVQSKKLVDETLEIVGLSALRDRYPAQLSGGPEAARGPGPRDRLPAQGDPAGRAAGRPRCEPPAADAALPEADPAPDPDHLRLRHP